MSAAEILKQIRRLPPAEQRKVVGKILEEFDDIELKSEQVSELEQRSSSALKHPEHGRPAEDVFNDINKRVWPPK